MPYEEGSIEIFLCPQDNCTNAYLKAIMPSSLCAFYELESNDIEEAIREEKLLVHPKWRRSGLMHHKFCADKSLTITGSTNPTKRGLNVNYNNIVIINSTVIAQNYRAEWDDVRKGRKKKTRARTLNLSGTIIENYFCPEDGCEEKVLSVLSEAEESIYFMTFSFTADRIGDQLVKKAKSGKAVKGIMESFGLNKYSEYEKLKKAGIPVALERTGAMLHHKVFILDKNTIITGSYNPTKSGTERNDENILIIHDPATANLYLREFYTIWNKTY